MQYCSSCQWPAQSHETTWSLNCVVVIHWKNNNPWHVQEWQFSKLRVVTLQNFFRCVLHIHCNVPQKYSLESLRNFLTVFSYLLRVRGVYFIMNVPILWEIHLLSTTYIIYRQKKLCGSDCHKTSFLGIVWYFTHSFNHQSWVNTQNRLRNNSF